MRKVIAFSLILFLVVNSSFAQVRTDGKWYFPDSVRAMCIDTEQGLVSQFKSLIERNREFIDSNVKIDTSSHFQVVEAIKKGIQEKESTWERLGCVYILYASDRLNSGRR
jgi:hypothetical protein